MLIDDHPIVVKTAFRAPLAIGHFGNHPSDQFLRLVEYLLHGLADCFSSILFAKGQVAVVPRSTGSDLSA